jgi:arylsulfatase A-like enzyme
MPNRSPSLAWWQLAVVAAACAVAVGASPARGADGSPRPARKPNVVVILADDIGYGDVGCYGATKVRTPNIDKLAAQGVRFTDGYAPSAVCTPSRFAMLTGVYGWRVPAGSRILPGDAPLSIPVAWPTVASLMKQNGYATGLAGKWHLGLGTGKTDFNGEIKPGPLEVGFDSAYFIPATVDRVPTVWVDGHRVANLDPADPITVNYQAKVGSEPTGKENPDQLKLHPSHGHDMTIVNGISRIGWMTGGKAARWVDEQIADVVATKATAFVAANKDKPFFLYVATHDVHVPRTPGPRFAGKSPLGPRGDVIEEFDDTVGRVLAALDEHGLTNDTLVIVSSDNGGVIDDGYKDDATEKLDGHSVNGKLKGFKGSLWEGGTRVPFVARWPGHIPPGRVSREVVSLVDVPAVAVAAAGGAMPAGACPDAVNVLPAFTGEGKGREALVLHGGGPGLAIRKGPYKLIPANRPAGNARQAGGGGSNANRPNANRPNANRPDATAASTAGGPTTRPTGNAPAAGGYGAGAGPTPKLFNVADDPEETKDLAAEKPELVAELTALLEKAKAAGPSPRE